MQGPSYLRTQPKSSAFVLLASILLLLACSAPRTNTIEGYAKAVCDSEARLLVLQSSPRSTWGQFESDMRTVLRELEKLTSPPELEEFHSATLELWRNSIGLIEGRDSQSLTSDIELFELIIQLATLDEPVNRAMENLPDEAFEMLSRPCPTS